MNMGHPEGESMRMGFDGGIKLEFHGAKVTSDGGLLAYRELDDALGLFDAVSTALSDQRTGRNIQHAMATLLRRASPGRLERPPGESEQTPRIINSGRRHILGYILR